MAFAPEELDRVLCKKKNPGLPGEKRGNRIPWEGLIPAATNRRAWLGGGGNRGRLWDGPSATARCILGSAWWQDGASAFLLLLLLCRTSGGPSPTRKISFTRLEGSAVKVSSREAPGGEKAKAMMWEKGERNKLSSPHCLAVGRCPPPISRAVNGWCQV